MIIGNKFSGYSADNRRLYHFGGGGGGTTQSTGTTYTTNIPEYAEPYVNTMLGATQKQLFDMSGNEITGFKPYKPYSTNANDYVAGFSPMQEQAMRTAASPEAFGREVGGYMSPYMQNVVDIQKREAMRGAGIMGAQNQAQATNAGAFGGYREGIQRAENQRNLGTQMNDIQLKGQQMAFDNAQQQARTSQGQQMQYGSMQQSQEQQKINQRLQDFANAQQYPLMQLGTMSNMLRGLPMQAQTTNQYVAAPNPITQGIGVAGAGASIYNATKGGAEGGLPSEFKYAEGGITAVPRYDVGGEVESQLESMDIEGLMKQAQESSSPTVRAMAKRILREKQMEQGADRGAGPTGPMGIDYQAPQGMAGGGIIAFQSGEQVSDPDAEAARRANEATAQLEEDIKSGKYVPQPTKFSGEAAVATPVAPPTPSTARISEPGGIKDVAAPAAPDTSAGIVAPAVTATPAAVAAPAPAAETPAGIMAAEAAPVKPSAPTFSGPLADAQRNAYEAKQEANLPDAEYLKRVKEGTPENVAAAELRKQIMDERANSKAENERQRQMRLAQFFAKWGSTPGPTLAAGLSALEKSLPDMIADEAGFKKAKRELDKIQFDIDNATRLEELGNKKEARALKEKAADRAMQLNQYLTQAQSAENTARIQQETSKYTADAHVRTAEIREQSAALDRAANRSTADDNKKFNQYQAATDQERRALERIAFEENGEQHKADVKLIENARLMKPEDMPEGYADKIAAAKKAIKERKDGWASRAETAKKNTELAYSRVRVTEPAAPAGGNAPPAPAAPTTMSMADVEATAKSSGKTVDEVKAAAKAKGITIK